MDKNSDFWERIRSALIGANDLTPEERGYILTLLDELLEISHKQERKDKSTESTWKAVDDHPLVKTIKQRNNELEMFKTLSINLTSSLDLPLVLNAVVLESMRLTPDALSAHIFLYHDGELIFGASLSSDGSHGRPPMMMPPKNGMTYAVAYSGKQIIIEDISNHPLYPSTEIDGHGVPYRSEIGIPLKINDSVLGVMDLIKTGTDGFDASQLYLLQLLADQAAIAVSNASLHQVLDVQAHSDFLTGLPNRRALDEHLEHKIAEARHNGHTFAAVMLDLDNFKLVNDSYGHTLGDQVLQVLSSYLAGGLRSTDFLARYGGDEFTLVLSQSDSASARIVTEKLLEQMAKFEFFLPDGNRITLGFSGGIAIYPLHATNAGDLLRAADEALYRAKRSRRGSFAMAKGYTGELLNSEINWKG